MTKNKLIKYEDRWRNAVISRYYLLDGKIHGECEKFYYDGLIMLHLYYNKGEAEGEQLEYKYL